MKHPALLLAAMLGALGAPSTGLAATGPSSFTGQSFQTALRSVGAASGTVTAIDGTTLTIQTAGKLTGTINALEQSATAVTQANYPYVWGGGHGEAGIASVGIKGGPGANGRRVGFDCSGSVAAVLAGAGLYPAGAGVPSDAGVIAELLQRGVIAKGPGQVPDNVTLYDDPGVHIFMNIAGRFFGTSDGSGGGNPKGGAGWLYDGAYDATSRAYRQYHFLPGVLRDQTSFGHIFAFTVGYGSTLLSGLAPGDKVKVTYGQSSADSMVATAIGFIGAVTTTQTITAVSADGSSFTAEGAGGKPLTYLTAGVSALLSGLQVGDSAQVTYTRAAGVRTARAVKVLSAPAVTQAAGTVTAVAGGGLSVTVQTAAGQAVTLTAGTLQSTITGLTVGEPVQVGYLTLPDGTLIAQTIAPVAQPTTGGGTGTPTGAVRPGPPTSPARPGPPTSPARPAGSSVDS